MMVLDVLFVFKVCTNEMKIWIDVLGPFMKFWASCDSAKTDIAARVTEEDLDAWFKILANVGTCRPMRNITSHY